MELKSSNKRCISLKSISCNGLAHNSTLMNINFGTVHYQQTLIFLYKLIMKANAIYSNTMIHYRHHK